MSPAVFVQKKTGEICLCVDYRELNKKTTRDAYPLPLPDEVQDWLAGSSIFSTLDLQSGYWQLPVNPADKEKTAFCPGPGMGLFQFCRMPFGLSGAPSSFQRFMDTILRGLSYVTIYLDDILVHSPDEEVHKAHLLEVFNRLSAAGVTLRGKKCRIGMKTVTYLGHVFSAQGMAPDPSKIQAVQEWPVPSNITDVRQFLGLASYYRHYIPHFSHIAAPLHALTQKNATFSWTEACQQAFTALKAKLIQPPVLTYPQFHSSASQFVVYTDASDVGPGVVLEQNNYVIAYASRTLSKSEHNYSVIQKNVWLLYTLLNNFGIIYLVEHSNFILITPHCSGCQHNEWKAYCADGHWPFKSIVLLSYIVEVLLTLMLIPYQDVLTRILLLQQLLYFVL